MTPPPGSAVHEGRPRLRPSGRQVARVGVWVSVQASSPQLAELRLFGLPPSRNSVGPRWLLFFDTDKTGLLFPISANLIQSGGGSGDITLCLFTMLLGTGHTAAL